ncbi:unnamed protein product [Nyctereutes procyonoides]|uniref:(raccoon dog) hypothetical protein n=1 Tax=Nyctereutes procyonoides TaxID=34880 RepID=A0A811Z6B8_NYCPR|nr:unnamed protein product [Nyctereutes procyonoides]
MPKIEETVLQNDPSEAEGGAHKPKTPGKSQENRSFCLEYHSPDVIEIVNEISKLNIAHEIVVNQDFYMEESVLAPNSLEGSFMETMYNGFWDHLKEQLLNTPPDFTCALKLLKEVKENLLSLLLPHQNRLRNEFEESLDMDLLKQETEYGALDVPHLSTHILNLMIMLCAQVRDEAVQKLESMTDPVQLLKGIFHVPGLMKMDIQSLQPYLQEHSVQYEQAKFQELLDKQPISYIPFYVVYLLDYTTKWLTKVATDLTTPSPSSPASPSYSSLACSPPNWAYLNLLLWDPDNDKFPESSLLKQTLLMDRIRLQKMESHLHQLTVLASVLLVARCFSGNVLFNSPEFGHSAFCPLSRPQETMLSVSEQVSREIHQGLKDMDLTALSICTQPFNTASLIGQLQNIAKKENCVCNIIDQRIRLFLKCCLVHGMQESLQDFPGGLSLIEGELAELSWKFFNLMHHNQQVFSPYYAEILKNIIPPAQAHETEVESIR